jgi:hypothetical protein
MNPVFAPKRVPFDANSVLLKSRYTALAGEMEPLIAPARGTRIGKAFLGAANSWSSW